MTLPAPPSPRTRRSHLRWIVGVFALCLFFVLLRACVIEGFHVPTVSMEPTLRGDPQTGDKVFVNKLAFLRTPPRRWQIVAFRKSLASEKTTIVKRLVGLPGETVKIQEGDVYVDGARARKPRSVQDELLFPVFGGELERKAFVAFWNVEASRADDWDLSSARLGIAPNHRVEISTRADVRDRYEHANGPATGGDNADSDLAIRARLRPLAATGTIAFTLAKDRDRAELRLELGATSRAGTLRLNGADVTPVGGGPIAAGSTVSILFWNLDGELRVELDGRELYAAPYLATAAVPAPPRRNDVRIEVDGAGAQFESLEVLRDVYYTAEGEFVKTQYAVRLLPEGDAHAYFFLGDNSPSSEDSRQWGPTLVRPSDLVGAPFMIYWPPSRVRLLR